MRYLALDLGDRRGCAVMDDQTLRCWDDSSTDVESVPDDLGPVSRVYVGDGAPCAIETDGHIYCWGGVRWRTKDFVRQSSAGASR